MTAEGQAEFVESEVRSRLGLSVAGFAARYRAGELDDSNPDVPLLAIFWGGWAQRAKQIGVGLRKALPIS